MQSAFPSVILGRALRERGPTPAPADSAGRPQGNLPSASPPASGPAACLSFPVCAVGAALRSPGERSCSCRRRQPGNPWTQEQGDPWAAGSWVALASSSCRRDGSGVLRPLIPGDPPSQRPRLGRPNRHWSPAAPGASLLPGDPGATSSPPAGWGPRAMLRGAARRSPQAWRAPKLPAPPTCRRCRAIQPWVDLPCPGGKGLTWARCDPRPAAAPLLRSMGRGGPCPSPSLPNPRVLPWDAAALAPREPPSPRPPGRRLLPISQLGRARLSTHACQGLQAGGPGWVLPIGPRSCARRPPQPSGAPDAAASRDPAGRKAGGGGGGNLKKPKKP